MTQQEIHEEYVKASNEEKRAKTIRAIKLLIILNRLKYTKEDLRWLANNYEAISTMVLEAKPEE